MMLLHNLVYELQLAIIHELESERDINAFTRSHPKLYIRFNSYLYQHNVQQHSSVGLIAVAREGRVESIRKFLEEGANADTEKSGIRPLDLAIRGNHLKAAVLLLSADCVSEKARGERAIRALSVATHGRNEEMIDQLLLLDGTSFNYSLDDITSAVYVAERRSHEGIVLRLLDRITLRLNQSRESSFVCYKLLSLAAEYGHEASVKGLLEEGCPTRDRDGKQGPLLASARKGHIGVTQLLFGADTVTPDSADEIDTAPIFAAACHGHSKILQLLIEKYSVNSEIRMALSQAAMHQALSAESSKNYDDDNAIRRLLDEYEIAVDDRLCDGNDTPLTCAAREARSTVVRLLLNEYGADPDSRDRTGRTPLSLAASSGDEDMVTFLLEEYAVDPDSTDCRGRTPLSWAASSRRGEPVLKLLLQYSRVDPNFPDIDGRTPLSWAVCGGKLAIELLLADSRVYANAQDRMGRTPLSWAAEEAGEEEFRVIFAGNRIDPTLPDRNYRTPFSWAMAGRLCRPVIELMLGDSRIDPDFRDCSGRTPLSFAVENGQFQGRLTKAIVQLLLSTGRVNPDAQDDDGRTPLSWAMTMVQDLGNYYPPDCNPAIPLLLANDHVTPDLRDRAGRTPLSWAAEQHYGDAPEVTILLEDSRVDPNSRDQHGRTPLSWAAEKGGPHQVRLLLADGRVERDARDFYGRTPLSWAVRNDISVREILLQAGCLCEDGKQRKPGGEES